MLVDVPEINGEKSEVPRMDLQRCPGILLCVLHRTDRWIIYTKQTNSEFIKKKAESAKRRHFATQQNLELL